MLRSTSLPVLARQLDLPSPGILRDRLAISGVAAGVLLALWPVVVRAQRIPTLKDLAIWFAGLALAGASLMLWDAGHGMRRPRFRSVDLIVLILPAVVAGLLTVPTLTDPYFSAVGDEYAFWLGAKELANGRTWDPFTQAGVYGNHPALSSYAQAVTLKVFGTDQFGWRISSALALMLAAVGLAALGTLVHGRAAGIAAGVTVAAAHPLLAYAHTGYNNIQAVPLMIWSLALGMAARKWKSVGLALLAGAVAGLGWYTFYLSRAAIGVLLVLLVLQTGRGSRIRDLAAAILGFVLAVFPLLAASKWDVLTKMLAESAAKEQATIGVMLQRVLLLLHEAFLAPWGGHEIGHYISGPLLDQVSGVAAALGLVVGALLFWRAPFRWMWVWYGIALLAGGATSQYDALPTSRSFFILPPLLLFGGVAIGMLVAALKRLRIPPIMPALAGAALMVVVMRLNSTRLWQETPARQELTVEAAAAIGTVRFGCLDKVAGPLFVSESPEAVFEKLVDAYGWTNRVQLRKMPADFTTNDLALERCIIAFGNDRVATTALTQAAQRWNASANLRWILDGPGRQRALVLLWKPNNATLPIIARTTPALGGT